MLQNFPSWSIDFGVRGAGTIQAVSEDFIQTLATLLSQWAFALLVGCLLFTVVFAALSSVPAALRQRRLFWLVEFLALPLIILVMASVPIALFGLSAGDVWYQRTHEVKGVLLTLVFAYLANRAISLFLWQGVFRSYDAALPGIIRNLLAFLVYVVAIYVILAYVFKQPVTGLLVSSGIALGVLGLAFQSTLTDIITGIALAIERPFSVGDWIELDNNVRGRVESIDWRATCLKTINGTTHVIPNNRIGNTSIHRLSRGGEKYGFVVPVSVSGQISPLKVRKLLLEAAIAAPEIASSPPPLVRVARAEYRPIQYLATLYCDGYLQHFSAKEAYLVRAWEVLRETGAEIAVQASSVEYSRANTLQFRDESEGEALSKVTLLDMLRPDERQQLLSMAQRRELAEGVNIVNKGDDGQSFFVVLSGLVRIFLPRDEERKEELELALLGEGSFFGEMSLLTGEQRSASISAHTRTHILEIPKSAIAPILAKRAEVTESLAQMMAERKLANEGILRASQDDGFAERFNRTTREMISRIQKFFGE